MAMVFVSAHADMRMKQRMGAKSARRRCEIAEEAYARGTRLSNCRAVEREYILSYKKDEPEYEGRELVLFMDMIFVFSEARLITVLPKNQVFSRRLEKIRCKCRRRDDRGGMAA